jgi:hypothetical protein
VLDQNHSKLCILNINDSSGDQLYHTPSAELTRASLIMRLTAICVVIAGIAGLFDAGRRA